MKRFKIGHGPRQLSEPRSGSAICTASSGNYICTREDGHSGKHQASGLSRAVLAEWD